jgi:hypothetical protein
MLIDLIPKIYDVPRIVRILGEDGTTEQRVKVDPMAKVAYQKTEENEQGQKIVAIFNNCDCFNQILAMVASVGCVFHGCKFFG